MEHYLFLSSQDSLQYHKSNHWSDFTVELNQDLFLEGRQEVALLDLTCDVKTPRHVTLCCDLSSPSWIKDQFAPMLRSFYATEGYFTINFPVPYYTKSHACTVKRMRMLGDASS